MCSVLYEPDYIVFTGQTVDKNGNIINHYKDCSTDYWNELSGSYKCVTEGLAELTHGIDDERFADICLLAQSQDTNFLERALSLSTNYSYAGGYMLLRYFAFQSAENSGSVLNCSSSNMLASSVPNSVVSDSIVSAASMLWTDEQPATVADTGSELASAMNSITNAMLTPFGSTDSVLIGSDSLSTGLFSENKKSTNFLG